ncbi:MFS transporter [Ancylobacter sp. WKF20]|uniref:MFS transporter n=1 Tax=Ancylobacter sp. WKF20 TaxID=3039801 RepID=UPI0024345466|nr:MFS transporter [Ancylobacter sp. WKF20]WGD31898.1 MFS transporter [Ancylobacter sp. WKF20]
MPSFLSRFSIEPDALHWLEQRSWHPWLVIALVCIGAFVGQLDATIVQLALPTLSHAFDVPIQKVSWVALSYLLAFASFLPIFGRLCEMVGRKSLYLVGYALFIVASALCGLAATFEQLLVFRFLQGMGGALLGANSISILVATIPAASRGRALGFFAAAQAVGMSAGPALGGLILVGLGWRWVFWVTVPFGAVAMVVGWLALPRSRITGPRKSFDWTGALLIGPALILLVATLNHASHWGLLSAPTLGGFAISAVLLGLLVRHERRCASPLIAPRLLQSAGFRFGAMAVTLAYGLLYGTFFLMSFALEHGYGQGPAEAGFRLAIIPVAIGLSAPFSHDIRQWLGRTRIGGAAMLLCLLAIMMMRLSVGLSPYHKAIDTVAFTLIGIGLGLFIAPNNNATLAAVPTELSGAAGALLNLMRVLGTSLGVALGASSLSWRLEEIAGTDRGWNAAGSANLLTAVRDSLPLLGLIAVAAAVAAWAATRPTPPEPKA